MAETQWNPWVDLADEWPDPRQRRGRRYEWATLLVLYSDEQLAVHPTRPTGAAGLP